MERLVKDRGVFASVMRILGVNAVLTPEEIGERLIEIPLVQRCDVIFHAIARP